MGAYDGYKYAKKKGYKGWKMYASIAGGAALGAVNPFKIFKMAKSGYKAYKAVKYTKKARNVYKKTKRVVKVKAKPKATVVAKKQVKSKAKVSKAKKSTRVVKKQTKKIKPLVKNTKNTHVRLPDELKNFKTQRQVVNSFKSGQAKKTTYDGGTTLYRVVGKGGNYWSLDPPPATEYQWRVEYTIKQEVNNDATTLYKMTIPEGATVEALEGTVGSQGMGLYGGARQSYINYRAIPKEWIQTTKMEWK